MNDKMKELYVEFHTKRRLKIERLTEERFQHYIKEGCNNSPAIRKDALYWAMEQTSEEEQFSDFAELIVNECAKVCWDKYRNYDSFSHNAGVMFSIVIKKHFGVEDII